MHSILIRAFYSAISFGITVLLARALPVEDMGRYSLVFVLISLTVLIGQSGLTTQLVREVSYSLKSGMDSRVRELWHGFSTRSFNITLVSGSGSAIYFIVAAEDSAFVSLSFPVLLIVPILLVQSNMRAALLRALDKNILGQIPDMVIRPIAFLFFVMIAWLCEYLDALVALYLYAFSSLFAFCIGVHLLRAQTQWGARSRSFQNVVKPHAMNMFWAISMMQALNLNLDLLMVGGLLGDANVAILRIGVQSTVFLSIIIQGMNLAVQQPIASSLANNDTNGLKRTLISTNRLVLLATLPVFLALFSFSEQFVVHVFGGEYVEAALVLKVLLVGHLLNSLFGPVVLLNLMARNESLVAKAFAFTLVSNFLMQFLFVEQYGVVGAAIATSCSILIWNSALALAAMRNGQMSFRLW